VLPIIAGHTRFVVLVPSQTCHVCVKFNSEFILNVCVFSWESNSVTTMMVNLLAQLGSQYTLPSFPLALIWSWWL